MGLYTRMPPFERCYQRVISASASPKHTRLLYLETICGVIVRLDCVIVWVFSLQKAHDMCVDLLELEQKPIVSVRRIDDNELRVGNVFGQFALLGYCK